MNTRLLNGSICSVGGGRVFEGRTALPLFSSGRSAEPFGLPSRLSSGMRRQGDRASEDPTVPPNLGSQSEAAEGGANNQEGVFVTVGNHTSAAFTALSSVLTITIINDHDSH